MKHIEIDEPKQIIHLNDWTLAGDGIVESQRTVGDLKNVFANEEKRSEINQETVVYKVQAHFPVKEGTPGGLYYGTSIIEPGKVGDEYFMTRGHIHSLPDRTEYYWGVKGEGVLLLMDEKRNMHAERIFAGSLHFIGANIAHRIANTGSMPLYVGACWPSDAGHNYEEIDQNGFSARLIEVEGQPVLIQDKFRQ